MADTYAAFRNPAFARYFIARFATSFSAQIISSAVGWHVYYKTGEEGWLGWIGLVQFLPMLALVIVTGFAADRLGRRNVMGSAIALEAACALVLLTLTVSALFSPVLILCVLAVFGIARAFYAPASGSLVVNLVPKEHVASAISLVTASWQAASIFGPVAGGLLFGLGASMPYAVAFCIFLAGVILTFTVPQPQQTVFGEPATLTTLFGGFRFVWKEKLVLGAISLDMFAVLLGGAVALMPVYARDVLHLGPIGNGLLRAAPGIGAIIVGLWLARFPVRDHAGIILFFSVALFGFATAIFGASRLAWLSILALVLVGGFDMISVYIREVLMQLWTPDEVRGRVTAVNSIFLGASNELGEARAGFQADFMGAVATVVTGGMAAVAVAGIWAALFPRLRKAKTLQHGPGI
jgi:MFS family permease